MTEETKDLPTWRQRVVIECLFIIVRIIGGVDEETRRQITALRNHIAVSR